jgi:peptide/nickel transport system substrate-binding protein
MRSTQLAVASCIVATCISLSSATRPRYGGVLKIDVSAQLTRLEVPESNPSWQQQTVRDELLRIVYDRLTTVDNAGRVIPMLVTGWEHSPDFKRWTFALRKNVELHDGSALTTPDVVAALSQANPGWHARSSGDSVVIESDAQLPELPEMLADTKNSIMVRHGQVTVGSGPFRVDTWQAGRLATFVAHDNCWQGRPYLDAIQLQMGQPYTEQLLHIESRQADIVEVPIPYSPRLQQGGVRVEFSSPQDLYALLLAPAISKDSRLRDALSASIDRGAIENVFLQRRGSATAALLPQWITGYAALFPAARDLERAQQLRHDLGNLPAMNLGYDNSDPLARTIAERIALNARDAGINLRPAPGDISGQSTTDIKLLRIALPSANAALDLDAIADQIGMSLSFSKDMTDADLFQAENQLLKSQALIPLAHVALGTAMNARVRNWSTTPDGRWHLENLWIEGR